jgi:glucosamine--fructose-6-phosphate aminotransferase (isomerizing)
MCGIVGCISKSNTVQPVIDGLKALEYRGYDSAGIAFIAAGEATLVKKVGRVDVLESALSGMSSRPAGAGFEVAVGHTRWATHGAPTTANAHPHSNTDGTIFVVHNGIIENYALLKTQLEADGYTFTTQTDTEVVPHLIDHYYNKSKNLEKAFEQTLKELNGAYAIAMVSSHEPNKLFAAKLSSPLIIGVGEDALYLASDPTAVMDKTKDVIFVDDYEMVVLEGDKYRIKDLKKAITVNKVAQTLDFDVEQAQLGDFPHFMLKEIYEGPQTIQSAIRGRVRLEENIVNLGGLAEVRQQLQFVDRIVIVACGTSYYAGLVGEYLIEEIAGIPVEVQLASEFKYRKEPFSRSTALIAISQSGETADTIAALKKVKDYGVLTLGVVNAIGSTISRMTDAGVYCHAGPEQAVASTKAFMAQVTVLSLIALELSKGNTPLYRPMLEELTALPDKVQKVLDQAPQIQKMAQKYAHYRDFLFLGRNYAYPVALEGALKLKELSYIHAEGCSAGEMKHGPLAMITPDFPTFALINNSELAEKIYSNMEEVKARKGPLVAIAPEGDKRAQKLTDDVIFIPSTLEQIEPLLMAVVLQLFSYYVAVELGHDVDHPRNLAKSVTVE